MATKKKTRPINMPPMKGKPRPKKTPEERKAFEETLTITDNQE